MSQEICPSCNAELPRQRSNEVLASCPECGTDLMEAEGEWAEEGLSPQSIAFGVGAALLGIAIWVGVSVGTGYEIGWLAWGIGALVGFAMLKGGGFGLKAGVVAAVLAFVGIAGGRAIAVQMHKQIAIDELMESPEIKTQLLLMQSDGQAFAKVEDPSNGEQLREFLRDNDYEGDGAEGGFSDDYLAEFRSVNVPQLIIAGKPNGGEILKAQWTEDITAEASFFDVLKESLSPIDALFLLLGIGTAFKMAAGS